MIRLFFLYDHKDFYVYVSSVGKKLKKGKEKMALFNKTEEVVPEETIYKTYSDAELKDIARGMHTKYTDKIMREIHAAVENKDTEILQESKDRITAAIKDRLNHPLNDGYTLDEEQITKVLRFIRSMAWGYDELDPLIQDDTISDIKIYSYDNIRIKRMGQRMDSGVKFESPQECARFITRILERNGVNFGTANADQTFTDRSQDSAILRISAIAGILTDTELPCIAIRKVPKNKLTISDLSSKGMFDESLHLKRENDDDIKRMDINIANKEINELIPELVNSRGILFTGKGASGKTTFMNALIDLIPHDESMMICQENSELFVKDHPDCLCAHVAINGGDSKVSYTLGDLTRMGLLIDLDRIIVGEVKQADEAAGLSKASMTGHKCWTSVHGENCDMAISKMADYISQANRNYSFKDCLAQLEGFEYVIHLRNFQVDEIVHIKGWNRELGILEKETVYSI